MRKTISSILAILLVSVFAFFAIASSSEGEETKQEPGQAQAGANDSNVGDYSVEIKSARLTKDWEGKNTVVITYGFTNNGDNAISFSTAISDNAYQNGVGLEQAFILKDGDPYDDSNQYKEIKKGATLDVEIPYVLNDSESDVEVEVEEWISFSDDKVSRTFSIK